MAMTRKKSLKAIEKNIRNIISRRPKRLFPSIILFLSGIFLIYLFFLLKDVPNPAKLTKNPSPVSTKILDRSGKLLYEVYSEYRRTPIALNNVARYAQEATIAIEDKNFYHHHGLDTIAILRAAFKTLTGQRLEGG